jgi:hypothetical protein
VSVAYHLGDRTEQFGTLACIFLGVNILLSVETLTFLRERKESFTSLIENFKLDKLYSKPSYQVPSKALSISENTAAVVRKSQT